MKKYFLTGLIILLPIALTCMIFIFLIDLLTHPFEGLVHKVLIILDQNIVWLNQHRELLTFIARVVVLIILCFGIFVLGYIGSRILKNFLLDKFDQLIMKIPFIKKIYKTIKDVVKTFLSDSRKAFESTVVVPFPFEGSYALGFQSGDAPTEALEKAGLHLKDFGYKSVFVPTAPHPISGFLLITEEPSIKKVDISTEEAFKFLISAGLFKPGESSEH